MCKIAGRGKAVASASDRGRGAWSHQQLPVGSWLVKTESSDWPPPPTPGVLQPCPVSPHPGLQSPREPPAGQPGSCGLPLPRRMAQGRGGGGGLRTRGLRGRDTGSLISARQSPHWAAAGPIQAPGLTWPAWRPRPSPAGLTPPFSGARSRVGEPETSGPVLPSQPDRREAGAPGARLAVWGGGGGV